MDLILTHIGADFDALASMVAARKLYPGARMVLPGSPDAKVREFVALHRGHFPVEKAAAVRRMRLERVILVDTREPSRLGEFQRRVVSPEVRLHIYDHHPATAESIRGDVEVIEPLGAATTVVLKRVRQRGLPVTPLEATLFLLGIYEETGSLTFPSTTSEDLRLAAWLLDQGGNLGLVPRFIQHSLDAEQRELLGELLRSCRVYPVRGFQILVAHAIRDSYVDELALLTHRLLDLERTDAVFTLVWMRDRTYAVGRSRSATLNMARVLEGLGGGGHPTAASASLKGKLPEEVLPELLYHLERSLPQVLTAADLMSTPVHCLDIDEEKTVDQAAEALRRLGHSALCVRQGGRVVGMIARSDVDKAQAHDLGHAPVHAYMSRPVVSVSPNTPLPVVQRILAERDIGRVPVLKEGRLVGIVSRTDVLRALHGSVPMPPPPAEFSPPQLLRLKPFLLDLLRVCGAVGREEGVEVYAVGGFVRDLLLGVPNLDVDLVVEGDGIAYARVLAGQLAGRTRAHEKFGTAVVILPDGFRIDVATARTETYTRPAALPVVQGSTLKQDLFRRDFSINAMALRLHPEHFGQLVDYFGSFRDLQNGVVRVLHNLSFVEDPTRIFRAIKFEQRYHFRMEPGTEHLLRSALSQELLRRVSPERIRDEVVQILSEDRPIPAIRRMGQLRILRLLHPNLTADSRTLRILEQVEETLDRYKDLVRREGGEPWLVYLSGLLAGLPPEEVEEVARRYRISAAQERKLRLEPRGVARRIKQLSRRELAASRIHRCLSPLSLEAVLYLFARTRSATVRRHIDRYLRELRHARPLVRGRDLKAWGYPPGPRYGEILQALFDAQLDGEIGDREEARRWVAERW